MDKNNINAQANMNAQAVSWQQSKATALSSLYCVLSAIRILGQPFRVLDVGCGPGHICRALDAMGSSAVGLDINTRHAELLRGGSKLVTFDLTNPLPDKYIDFDLVICMEVAEHLPPWAADTLCDGLSRAVGVDGYLLFSAATPGQGGSGHLNERPHEFWRDKLVNLGLTFEEPDTDYLRSEWKTLAPGAWWYGKNLQIFKKER